MRYRLSTFVITFSSLFALSQAPQSFNYQGLARDNKGNAMSNQTISIKASILEGSATGNSVYSELHSVTTNDYGLFALGIGSGSVVSGNFASIPWSISNKFLKIEIDPTGGNNFSINNTSQLVSVPYSLHAQSVTTENQTLKIEGKKLSISQGNSVDLSAIIPNQDSVWSKKGINAVLSANYSNVGIGVIAPTSRLHTKGSIRFEGLTTDSNLTKSLVIDVNGNIYTKDISSVGNSQWKNVSGGISYGVGKVGIGTSNPTANLHTTGNIRFEGLTNNTNLNNALVADADGNIYTKDISNIGSSQWTNVSGGISYGVGKVGIGTSANDAWFSIEKNATGLDRAFSRFNNTSNDQSSNVASYWFAGTETNNSYLDITVNSKGYFPEQGNGGEGMVRSERLALTSLAQTNPSDGYILFRTGGSWLSNPEKSPERMRIDHLGNIGINTKTPTQKLDINGKVRIRDLALNTMATQLVVSDSNGVLGYKEISTLNNASQWSNNSVGINYNGGKVGIGTINPTANLHTTGNIRFEGLTNNTNLNNALVADADGNIYTKDISNIVSSQWTNVSGGISYGAGKVGIGTSNPDHWLLISKNANGADRNYFRLDNTSNLNSSATYASLHSGTGTNNVFLQISTSAKSYFPGSQYTGCGAISSEKLFFNSLGVSNDSEGYIKFSSGGNAATNPSGNKERMRVDYTGNIGIGTTSPKSLLHVSSGDVYIDDASKGIIMKNSQGKCYRIGLDTNGNLTSNLINCP